VSGLVSEKAVHSQNLFQTFAAIETIEHRAVEEVTGQGPPLVGR
jgi:hypothetical protein